MGEVTNGAEYNVYAYVCIGEYYFMQAPTNNVKLGIYYRKK